VQSEFSVSLSSDPATSFMSLRSLSASVTELFKEIGKNVKNSRLFNYLLA
jgi:hypothetical protein